MKKKLTRTLIDSAARPTDGDLWIWDTDLDGFGVRVQPSGRKTYVIRYRNGSRTQRKLTIARCSDMVPEKARELARKRFAEVAEGKDPAAEKKVVVVASTKTVERMFQGYVGSLKAAGKASAREVERALLTSKKNCAAEGLGRSRAAADITPADIVAYVSGFFDEGHRASANKHRGYITSAYNWAIHAANDYTVPVEQRVDFGLKGNPGALVKKDTAAFKTRDRNLTADELRLLWQATARIEAGFMEETGAVVRMMICCGQRVRETLRIDGCEIDLDKALWTMPAHKSKTGKVTGRPHIVPLPRQAVEVLASLKEQYGDGPLFPSRYGAGQEAIVDNSVMQAIKRWYRSANVEPFQTRDLRRTWKSRAGEAGIDRFMRDKIQQHSQNSDMGSKHYDRMDYLPLMREAMKKWEDWLDKILKDDV